MAAALGAERLSRERLEAERLSELRLEVLRAEGRAEEVALELKGERQRVSELQRTKEVFKEQLEAVQAELVKEHGRAFDLKARGLRGGAGGEVALEDVKTLQELRTAEEERRKELEERRIALVAGEEVIFKLGEPAWPGAEAPGGLCFCLCFRDGLCRWARS